MNHLHKPSISKYYKTKYFFFALLLAWAYSSCTIPNPFEDEDIMNVVYPDTTVEISSLTPQKCTVTVKSTDSTYHISSYWTDKQTGRIIYKMDDSPYVNSRLHGVQFAYDEDGDTLLIAHFENGIRVDSTVYYYDNGKPKHKFFYTPANDGNIDFEVQFHKNGQRKTDIVRYDDGLLNGAVDYYDDTPENERTETFYYREGELIGIKIYNKLYSDLDRETAAMLKAYRKDSTRLANLALEGATASVPVFYVGTERDALYDVGEPDSWNIMDIDPAFMLKYENR